jgi:hypothetical protein
MGTRRAYCRLFADTDAGAIGIPLARIARIARIVHTNGRLRTACAPETAADRAVRTCTLMQDAGTGSAGQASIRIGASIATAHRREDLRADPGTRFANPATFAHSFTKFAVGVARRTVRIFAANPRYDQSGRFIARARALLAITLSRRGAVRSRRPSATRHEKSKHPTTTKYLVHVLSPFGVTQSMLSPARALLPRRFAFQQRVCQFSERSPVGVRRGSVFPKSRRGYDHASKGARCPVGARHSGPNWGELGIDERAMISVRKPPGKRSPNRIRKSPRHRKRSVPSAAAEERPSSIPAVQTNGCRESTSMWH